MTGINNENTEIKNLNESETTLKSGKGNKRKKLYTAIFTIILALIIGFGIFFLLARPPSIKLPETESELSSSIDKAKEFLNENGKKLLARKLEEAPVYSVKAKLDEKEFTLSSVEHVLFKNRSSQALEEIVFRVYPKCASVKQDPKGNFSLEKATVDGNNAKTKIEGSLLRVSLGKKLPPQESTLVFLTFKENLPKIDTGFGGLLSGITGKDGYGVFGRSEKVYNLGYFFPVVASFKDGKWENREPPSFGDIENFECSYFNVSLEVPANYTVAANGNLAAEKTGGGRKVSYFTGIGRDFTIQTSPEYKIEKRKAGEITVSHYYLKSSEKMKEKVLDFASNTLKNYQEHFGAYPYKSLNICEAPLSGGVAGMEFSGQILISQMLYGETGIGKEKLPKELEKLGDISGLLDMLAGSYLSNTLEFVTAHEVAHQWWGETVGSDAIGHPWQDESLANWSAILYFRWQHGKQAEEDETEKQIYTEYSLARLMGAKDAVVDQPSSAFSNQHEYTAAVYLKGSLFMKKLESIIGTSAFEKSLREYYEKYAFLSASPEELISCFTSNSTDKDKVQALYEHWIKEKHGDRDIPGIMPGIPGSLEDLLRKFKEESGLDFGPIEDMLKDLMKDYEDLNVPFSIPLTPEDQTI